MRDGVADGVGTTTGADAVDGDGEVAGTFLGGIGVRFEAAIGMIGVGAGAGEQPTTMASSAPAAALRSKPAR